MNKWRDQAFNDEPVALKVVVVGNGGVGKSSMIQRFATGIFTRDYKKTIGVDFLEKNMTIAGIELRMMLWDTAGQEEFHSITRAYYRGAQGCVIVYSCSDPESFSTVESWKHRVTNECGDIPMVLVHNKVDLADECQRVKRASGEELAKKLKISFHTTSVMRDQGVNEVFKRLASANLERILTTQRSSTCKKEIADTVLISKDSLDGKLKKRRSIFSKCKVF